MTTDNYKSGSVELEGHGPLLTLSGSQIFDPFNPPVIVCGGSGSGKTVTAVDAVYSNADRLTGLIYICNSYDDPRAAMLKRMIPSRHVKNFSIQEFATIWGDVLKKAADCGRALDEKAIDAFSNNYCAMRPDFQAMMAQVDSTYREHQTTFEASGVTDGRMALNCAKRAIILQYIATHFLPTDPNFTEAERSTIAYSQSSAPLPVIIFDDISAALRTPPLGKVNIPSLNEAGEIIMSEMSGTAALSFLLTSLFTTMRGNGVGALFIHSLGILPAQMRQTCSAVILNGSAVVEELGRQKVVPDDGKALIEAAWEVAKNYKYHSVVYFNEPGQTSHGQRVALYKAKYWTDPIPLGVPSYRQFNAYIDRRLEMINQQKRTAAIEAQQVSMARQQLDSLASAPNDAASSWNSMAIPSPFASGTSLDLLS